MTRNFSPFSLKPVWNCVRMRLQNPRRQLRGGCGTRGTKVVELFIVAGRFLAISRAAKSVSLCAARHRLFSASYTENYLAGCVGSLGRESAIFQRRLPARRLGQRASDSPFGRARRNAAELQAYLKPRGAGRKREVVWTFGNRIRERHGQENAASQWSVEEWARQASPTDSGGKPPHSTCAE